MSTLRPPGEDDVAHFGREDLPVTGRGWWRALLPRRGVRWGVGIALLIGLIVALLLLSVFFVPTTLVEEPTGLKDLRGKERVEAENTLEQTRNSVRSTLVQAVGGGLVLLTFAVGIGQLVIARQGQLVDRFTKSIEQLGNEKVDVRLGGIYSLEQIAEHPEYARPVAEILVAYIKTHATDAIDDQATKETARTSRSRRPRPPWRRLSEHPYAFVPGADTSGQKVQLRPDLQAALRILVTKKLWARATGSRLDLSFIRVQYADLAGADLSGTVLLGAVLDGSNLKGARFRFADLRYASLVDADLTGSDLSGADLTQATLSGAILDEALLRDEALLVSALFVRARLLKADLTLVDATNADFTQASLNGATLDGAVLNGTTLRNVDLSGASLHNPRLDEATSIANATLTGADMDDETRKLIGRLRF